MVGKAIVPFSETDKSLIKKTKQSYVKIFDSFHSIDQFNNEDKPIGKIGELRVIIYLEDLGPVALIAGRMEELNDVIIVLCRHIARRMNKYEQLAIRGQTQVIWQNCH